MKNQFVTRDIAIKLKDLGFNQDCLAIYGEIKYPLDDSGLRFDKSNCLYLPYDDTYNEYKMLHIESKLALQQWVVGSYWEGEHSRCEFVGDEIKAPMWQQTIDWLREKYQVSIDFHSTFRNGIRGGIYGLYVINDYKNNIQDQTIESLYYKDHQEQAILKSIELCQKEK